MILVLLPQLQIKAAYLSDPQKKAQELAAVIDWGKPFVTATYLLESDGPLVMEAYEKIETVRDAIRAGHTPNINAVARRLCTVATIRVCCKEFFAHCAQEGPPVPIKLYSRI